MDNVPLIGPAGSPSEGDSLLRGVRAKQRPGHALGRVPRTATITVLFFWPSRGPLPVPGPPEGMATSASPGCPRPCTWTVYYHLL